MTTTLARKLNTGIVVESSQNRFCDTVQVSLVLSSRRKTCKEAFRAFLEMSFLTSPDPDNSTVPRTTTPAAPLITCTYQSPCYPGAECRQTPSGPQCGACPPGYTGDGYRCTKVVVNCSSKPCFYGVQCYDRADGYRYFLLRLFQIHRASRLVNA